MGLTSKQIGGAFKRFIKNKPKVVEWINKSFLSKEMKDAYLGLFEMRSNKILVR